MYLLSNFLNVASTEPAPTWVMNNFEHWISGHPRHPTGHPAGTPRHPLPVMYYVHSLSHQSAAPCCQQEIPEFHHMWGARRTSARVDKRPRVER